MRDCLRLLYAAFLTIRDRAVAIVRIVVVQRPVSIDIAHVVRVRGVRGTEERRVLTALDFMIRLPIRKRNHRF